MSASSFDPTLYLRPPRLVRDAFVTLVRQVLTASAGRATPAAHALVLNDLAAVEEALAARQIQAGMEPVRRREIDAEEDEPGADYFVKHGGFAELEVPASKGVDLLGRFDFLYRDGNVLTGSALSAKSAVVRYTAGTAITLERNLRAKFSTEFWSFSDADSAGRRNAVSAHAGLVGTF